MKADVKVGDMYGVDPVNAVETMMSNVKEGTGVAAGKGIPEGDKKCSLIVIGAGPGGYETAVRAARAGLEVTLVTSGPPGGTCLNAGCIPTKCLCHSAEQAMMLSSLGLPLPEGFWEKALTHKAATVEKLRAGVASLLKGVNVVYGTASFVDSKTVKVIPIGLNSSAAGHGTCSKSIQDSVASCVDALSVHTGADETTQRSVQESALGSCGSGEAAGTSGETEYILTADKIIIATGSESASLPIPGSDLQAVLDSTAILELSEIPSSLTVIGGGVIGLEFASIFAALGTEVTVLEYCKNLLPHFDIDLAKRLKQSLGKRGINIVNQAQVTEICLSDGSAASSDGFYTTEASDFSGSAATAGCEDKSSNTASESSAAEPTKGERESNDVTANGKKLTVKYLSKDKECSVSSDKVLMAVGRRPRTATLNLEAAGVEYTKRGISVDSQMRTSNPDVYAIGDVNGIMMLAHTAVAQGKVALNSILDSLPPFAFSSLNPDSIPHTSASSDSLGSLTHQTDLAASKHCRIRTDIVPAAVFTVPEVASVGLTEEECEAKGIEYKTVKSFYRANGKALAMDEPEGYCKIIVAIGHRNSHIENDVLEHGANEPVASGVDVPDPSSQQMATLPGQILGCHIIGSHSSDLIAEIAALMNFSATIEDLDNIIHAHPTLSEILVSGIV